MRKIAVVIFVIFFLHWVGGDSPVLAACANWSDPICQKWGNSCEPINCICVRGHLNNQGHVDECYETKCSGCRDLSGICVGGYAYVCMDNPIDVVVTCNLFQYACNRAGGCCDVGACEAAGSCPTACGQAASTVPNGSCGTTTCSATGSCCSPTDGGWSGFSTCQANCTQTRTCTNPSPDCGGASCSGPSSQTCGGGACRANITGTLFDASDLSSCPADIGTNPAYTSLQFGGATFDVTSTTPTTQVATTNTNGIYTVVVAPDVLPKTYSFDYTAFLSSGRVTELKLQCQGATATTIAGETVTKDTGFWRQYGGWWQVIGGSVHAQSGIGSIIPGSILPATNQKLILDDTDGRAGTLSYGLLLPNQLGTNPSAMVSSSQRETLSSYEGLSYDYNFYKTRMDVFTSTAWGGGVSYDDAGKGYQIYKITGNIDLNYNGPRGAQKVILLVDGSVTINQNITVPSGAFFAIIANGNITFNYNVDNAQGWYVSEYINIPCHDGNTDGVCDKDDVQFVGQGSFVGWTGINMTRDRAALNNQEPSEQFIYRVDLLLNAPEPMRVYTKKFSPFTP